MAIQGIIFDLGWTLLDFPGDIAATPALRASDIKNYLHDNGFDVNGAALYACYREHMVALYQLGESLNYEYPARLAMLRALRQVLKSEDAARLTAGALEASFASLVPQWQLYPDTMNTLTILSDAGYRLGCISNANDGAMVWRMIDRFDLRFWLSPIYTSEEFGLRKPHPRIFQTVLNDWGLAPDEVIMVGDTLNADVLGAHNAAMRGIWIDRGPVNPWSNNEESKAFIEPDATITQLAELPDLLSGDWNKS